MELSHSVNYLAVLVAAIANMVIGAVWFMPAVLGSHWMRFTGLTSEAIENTPHMWVSYLGSLIGSVLVAYAVARIASYAAAESIVDAAILMLLIWAGLVLVPLSDEALWERRPVGLFVLVGARWLVALAVITVIVALWV
jgi:hypothetical protein